MIKHLQDSKLINSNHHGSIKNHLTQTLILELHDRLVESLETGEDVALLQLDQSKAYNLISHQILIDKMRLLKFGEKTIKTIQSYLDERRQYVQIENVQSDVLLVGPKSVTQGSTLSCLFYLIFILDIPSICHDSQHSPAEAILCKQPNIDTFIDDNFVRITKPKDDSIENEVAKTMDKIKDYMDANKLALNAEKTKIMIVTKNKSTREDFEIQIDDKKIKHSKQMKVLGTVICEDLNFDLHLTSELIPNLKNRIRTLKMTSKYMSQEFKKTYTNAIFRGKVMFALEIWGGAKKSLITIVQKLQDRASEIALKGLKNADRLSKSQRNKILKWLPIEEEIKLSTMKMVNKILLTSVPAGLAALMPKNEIAPRIMVHHKLASKPTFLNKSLLTRSTFRNRAYIYNSLPGQVTSLKDHMKLKKWAKVHMTAPHKVPKDLNKSQMEAEANFQALR